MDWEAVKKRNKYGSNTPVDILPGLISVREEEKTPQQEETKTPQLGAVPFRGLSVDTIKNSLPGIENTAAQTEEEKTPWSDILKKAANVGFANFNNSMAGLLDATRISKIPGIKQFVAASREVSDRDIQKYNELEKSKPQQVVGDVVSAGTQMIPDVITMLATGGTATVGMKGAQVGAQLAPVTAKETPLIAKALIEYFNKPVSIERNAVYFGQGYDEAKKEGATESEAISRALLYAFPTAVIEGAGGIDTLTARVFKKQAESGGKALLQDILRSAIQEGAEEVVQYPFQAASKFTYKEGIPFYSEEGEAVINPQEIAYQGALGGIAGGVFGGGISGINRLIPSKGEAVQKQVIEQPISESEAPAKQVPEPVPVQQQPVQNPKFIQRPEPVKVSETGPVQQEPVQEPVKQQPEQEPEIMPTVSTPAVKPVEGQTVTAAENQPEKFGRNGSNAYIHWAGNEYVNIDLTETDDLRVQTYNRFTRKWYEAGRVGLPEIRVPQNEDDIEFPPFLQSAFYLAGKNDAEIIAKRQAKTDKAGINKQEEAAKEDVLDVAQYSAGNKATWVGVQPENKAAKDVMSLSNIIGKIRHDFNTPVSTGHIRKRNAAGVYMQRPETIRMRIANDLPTVSHELGHHLDKRYGLSKVSGAVKQELLDSMPRGFKNSYKKNELPGEGVAEFIRQYLSDRTKAQEDFKLFYPVFTGTLSAEDLKLVDDLADVINNYLTVDLSISSGADISMPGDKRDFRTFGEKIADKSDAVYQALVDSNHGIRRFTEFTGDHKAYILAANSAYSDAVASSIIMYDLRGIHGNSVGPGLKQALKGINTRDKKEFRAFNEYLVVLHGPERLKEGMRVFADNRKNNAGWMNGRQEELEVQYPEFEAAAQRVLTFNSQLLQTWAVDTGIVPAEKAAEWSERWKLYVPFNRDMSGEIYKRSRSIRRSYANQKSPYKKAHGSGLLIVSPVENIIRNSNKLVQAAIKNNVMQEITRSAAATEGTGAFLERVPAPIVAKKFDAADLKEDLKQSMIENLNDDASIDAAFEVINTTVDDILVQYGRGKAFGDSVTVMKDGEPEFWKINDPMLLESVTNMSPGRMSAFLEAYGRITRFMVKNITGNNILWAIFSNLPRDFMTFYNYSENKNPVEIIGGVARSYVQKLKSYTGSGKTDPLYLEFLAMGGGGHSSLLTADRDLAERAMDKLLAYNSGKYKNPLDWIETVSDVIEGGPRFAYYKIRRNAGLSPEQAFYESGEITTNFRRSGLVGRDINKVAPFFNASVQGLDRFARWIVAEDIPKEGRKKAIAGRWSAYILTGIILAAIQVLSARQRDEEGYERLSAYAKNSFWNIPLGNNNFFAIPKPREIAAFSSTMERVIETYLMNNPDAFKGFDDYLINQFMPPIASGIVQAGTSFVQGDSAGASEGVSSFMSDFGILGTFAGMVANKDFRGVPIVSQSMQRLEPRAQFDNRTSMIAKAVGDALNISPKMIDYFLNSTLGGIQKVNVALFPVGAANRDKTLGVKNTYLKNSLYSTDVINDFYDAKDKADKLKSTYADDAEYKIMANDYDDMATFYSRYNKLSKNGADTQANLRVRQQVIEMIEQFQQDQKTGYKTPAKRKLDELAASLMSTEFYPQVMSESLIIGEGSKKKVYPLTAAQYVEYQTVYLNFYWQEVEKKQLRNYSSDEKEAKGVRSAKATALEKAKAEMAKKLFINY